MAKKPVRKVRTSVIEEIRARQTESEVRRVKDAMRLAAGIGALMEKRGWNNTRLVNELQSKGITVQPSMVTRWLSGTANITQGTQSDIALALGVSTEELYAKPPEQKLLYETKLIAVVEPNVVDYDCNMGGYFFGNKITHIESKRFSSGMQYATYVQTMSGKKSSSLTKGNIYV